MSDTEKIKLTPEALEERLIDFAVRVIALANRLGTSLAGKHIAGQIVRSGTSPAPNYSEARSAESRADFVHKLRIVVKELNETSVWLRVATRSGLVKENLLTGLLAECDELNASSVPPSARPVCRLRNSHISVNQ